MSLEKCPLCETKKNELYWKNEDKHYFRCKQCSLVFLEKKFLPTLEVEKKQYDFHRNSAENEGYVAFLNQLIEPLHSMIKPNGQGLDYGCGPGPTLSVLMEKLGHEISLYDPFYFPEKSVLNQKYDFVTCTEVIEHVFDPALLITDLKKLLKSGGIIGMMTQEVKTKSEFPKWWYHRDPTHTRFYSLETFKWISENYNLSLTNPKKNVFILKSLSKK